MQLAMLYNYSYVAIYDYTSLIFDCKFYSLGPPIRYWTMRFEGKNKEIKEYARKSNFKNVCKTVAEQHQRRQCITLTELFCGNPISVNTCKDISV